jgi:hypothetical protein
MKSLKLLSLAFLLMFPVLSYAKSIDVDVILDLLDSRVSEASIQRFVERNQFTFQLSADDLVDLKKAGASDKLIEFLQQHDEQGDQQGQGDEAVQEEMEPSGDQGDQYGGGAAGYEPLNSGSGGVYFGVGFGYPYDYYYPYYPYYSYYSYYPYYPYYPYHCSYYGGHYHGSTYYSGSHGGTGVYSYWYGNHANGRPRGSRDVSSSTSTMISGRITNTAPPSSSGYRSGGYRVAPPSSSGYRSGGYRSGGYTSGGYRVARPGGAPSSMSRSFSGSYYAPRSGMSGGRGSVSRGMSGSRGMSAGRGMSVGRGGGGFHGGFHGGGGGRGHR